MNVLYFKLRYYLRHFLRHNKGAIAIEMALIIPIFLAVVMGILEYSIIFSLRSGINTKLQEVTRTRSTFDANFADLAITYPTVANPQGLSVLNKNLRATKALYHTLNDVVFDITQVSVATKTGNTLETLRDTPYGTPVNFSNSEPSSSMNFANLNPYSSVRVSYTYNYLTPMGRLVSGVSAPLVMTFVTFSRNY